MHYEDWNYGYLLEKASELEKGLPDLIKKQEWSTIHKILQIPQKEWNGVITIAYKDYVDVSVKEKREEIVKIPEILRKVVKDVQKRTQKSI